MCMRKMVSCFLLCLCMCVLFVPIASASQDIRTGDPISSQANHQGGGGNQADRKGGGSAYDDYKKTGEVVSDLTSDITAEVSTEDVVRRIDRMGNDVVRILQVVGKYVCVAGFIICCLLILVGLIGNKRLLAGGAVGAVVSGLAYAGIVCGREIVTWIAAWAAS